MIQTVSLFANFQVIHFPALRFGPSFSGGANSASPILRSAGLRAI